MIDENVIQSEILESNKKRKKWLSEQNVRYGDNGKVNYMVKNGVAVAVALLQVYSSCIAYALLPACELSVCFSVFFGTIPFTSSLYGTIPLFLNLATECDISCEKIYFL